MTHNAVGRVVARLAIATVGAIALAEGILALGAPEDGLLAVIQIVTPHLAIGGLLLVPIALLARRPAAVWVSVGLIALVVVRFGGDWVSIPRSAAVGTDQPLTVVTWNLEVGSRPGADTVAMIRDRPADLIALQELRPDAADAIAADPALTARYPYRLLVPREDVGGMGLLSRRPILDHSFRVAPILQQATIDLGGGRRLAVVNAHPFHAEMEQIGSAGPPVGLDSTQRNADLVTIRGRIGDLIDDGLPVLLLGDLNTAASEPAFDRFVRGLRDVHAEVGEGTGWTWRPRSFEFLGIGLVRIDHVVVSPDIDPVTIGVTCPPVGDHCLVQAELALPG